MRKYPNPSPESLGVKRPAPPPSPPLPPEPPPVMFLSHYPLPHSPKRSVPVVQMDRKPRVYIAGPLSLGDSFLNVREACKAANVLMTAGCVPFVPHLNAFWHCMFPREEEDWIQWDFAWLDTCDYLVRLRGVSKGADREVEYAQSHNIPVFDGVAHFLDYLDEPMPSNAHAFRTPYQSHVPDTSVVCPPFDYVQEGYGPIDHVQEGYF